MVSGAYPLPGYKPGKLPKSCGDTFTFLVRAVTHLPAKIRKSLKTLKELPYYSGLAAK